jgi:hypothetical protein
LAKDVSPYLQRRLRSLSEVLGSKGPAVRVSSLREVAGTANKAPVRNMRIAGIAADRSVPPTAPRAASGRTGD